MCTRFLYGDTRSTGKLWLN